MEKSKRAELREDVETNHDVDTAYGLLLDDVDALVELLRRARPFVTYQINVEGVGTDMLATIDARLDEENR